MTFELRHVAPLRAANRLAIVSAIVWTAFVLPLSPIFFFLPDPEGSDPEKQAQFVRLMMMMFFMYPIFGAIGGWVGGLVGSFAYNVVSRWLGGVKVVLETEQKTTTPTQVA